MDENPRFSVGQCATLACLLEVSAPKPGNVHRAADFEDMTLTDFLVSATAIAPAMDAAVHRGVGATVWAAVRATRQVVPVNTNLGTVLLLAPLACVPRAQTLGDGIATVLGAMGAEDSRLVYEAIRQAQPGGLGRVETMDIADAPAADLLAAMREAAPRDLVARQYANGFAQVLRRAAPWVVECQAAGWSLAESVVRTQLHLLTEFPDSLIARKCGAAVASQASAKAAAVLAAGRPGEAAYHAALADFDFWLRGDGHRRNPGTTADLIAAGLFAVLRDEQVVLPWH
jgi:triphosphoribosyl-dephospho-CoA synthase